jgi:hypothetical protein
MIVALAQTETKSFLQKQFSFSGFYKATARSSCKSIEKQIVFVKTCSKRLD